ncbi:hypothetical protein GCM10010094_73050 [Streptomyces flaveus]|uniref:Uncharacterized protein n=1 Tax=Streptomyces flaveus TaxID=66370 RepID=A0A917RCH9_9ACTN|nr:hypothetical protein GCM10010094_73050 [Streptomyces flaveus]
MAHRDHGYEGERKQAQDLADRDASVEGSGKSYVRHTWRGFPRRANGRLRAWGRRLTRRARPWTMRIGQPLDLKVA